MTPEVSALKKAMQDCQDADCTVVAFLLKPDGDTSYLGPPITDAEIVELLECAAEAFRQRAGKRKALN